jgi:hypothetical protein
MQSRNKSILFQNCYKENLPINKKVKNDIFEDIRRLILLTL